MTQGAADEPLRRAADAARAGDLAALDRILTDAPDVVRAKDDDGRTLLDLACQAATGDIAIPLDPGTPGQHAAVDRILEAGADPSSADPDGWTPLHIAAMAGHADLARRLIAAGAALDRILYGLGGGTPLSLALFYAKGPVAEVFAEPPFPDNLRTAAALGHDLERFFDGKELTADAVEGLDFYALSFFPRWQRTKSRQEVLDEALSWAARNNRCEAMARLVEQGANVNANPYRGTPLLWAIYSDRLEAATWLLDHGADPDLRHDWGGEGHGVDAVAMHLAAQYNCVRCLELLLERGASATIVDGAHGGTPLGWAEYGGSEQARALLEAHLAS